MKNFQAQELEEIREDWERNEGLETKDRLDRVAQLHACGPEDIALALGLERPNRGEGGQQMAPQRHTRKVVEPDEKKAAVREVLREAMTQAAVAEKYGVSLVTIRKWVAQARKTRQEFLDYPESAENPANAAADVPQKAPGVLDVPILPCRSSGAGARDGGSGEEGAQAKRKPSVEALAERANQIYSAVEGARCLRDEAKRYGVLPVEELAMLDGMIERMRHFSLGFEAGLAAAGEGLE